VDQFKSLKDPEFYLHKRGAKVSYKEWVKEFGNKPVPSRQPNEFVGRAKTDELLKHISARIPSSDLSNQLHAFFVRHVIPKVEPALKIDWEQYFESINFESDMRKTLANVKFETFEEWFAGVEPKKKASYRQGWNDFQATCRIAMNLQIVIKPDEKQVKNTLNADNFKGRNIFNPSNTVKSVLGYVAKQFMRWVMETDSYKGCFIQGYTEEQLENQFKSDIAKMDDPMGICWDGGNHDAHQHSEFIEGVDNYILSKYLPMMLPLLGFSYFQSKEIIKKATVTVNNVHLFLPGWLQGFSLFGSNRIVIFKGKLTQTTFSGHPTRTTLFNTMRIISLIRKFATEAGLVFKRDYYIYQSGDDTYILCESRHSEAFRKAHFKYYSATENVVHGYGQLSKDYKEMPKLKESGYTHVDFLSKTGYITKTEAVFTRQNRRLIATGDITSKISHNLSENDYLSGIKYQIEAHYSQFPCYKKMLDFKFGSILSNQIYIVNQYSSVRESKHEYSDVILALHPDGPQMKILEHCDGDPTLCYPGLYKV